MTFDAGTWWLVAGIFALLLSITIVLISAISKYVIMTPLKELKITIEKLTDQLHSFSIFTEVQNKTNYINEKCTNDILKDIEKQWQIIDLHEKEINLIKGKL